MASIFYQTLMYLIFCCTWGAAFFAVWVNCADIYKTVCVASILWSAFLFALTEGLSYFKAITADNLIIAWGIYLFFIGSYCLTKRNLLREKINFLKQSAVSLYRDNGVSVKALIIFIAFFMIARTVLAVITAPHNADSMGYHLARIGYWIQHQNVDYYETTMWRQIYSPVFSEYINLHVFLVAGGDLYANMLQNLSAYGCLILLYGIIKKLGCGIKWALFACILALSMNIFSAESMSTQVDMVGAFYLMTLTYLMIEVLYQPKLSIFQFMLLGFISGLIYITKTNICIPAAVIIIYVVLARLFKRDFKIIPLGLVSLIFITAIVSPTFYRNYNTFNGDFMANVNVGRVAIGTASPKYVLINVIKNLITIGFERNTELIRGGLKAFSQLLNVDINAPEISFNALPFGFQYFLYMDAAGAHLVTPLFVIVTFIALAYFIKRRTRTDGLMFALILQMYSMLILLRWQPWGSRLMLPPLVVVIIPIIYYFNEMTKRYKKDSWKYKACYFLVLELIFQCGCCSTESLIYHSYFTARNLLQPDTRYARYWGISQRGVSFRAYSNFSRLIDEGNYEKIGIDAAEECGFHYPILAKYVPQGKKVEAVTLFGSGGRKRSVYSPDDAREVKPLNVNFSPDIILVDGIALDAEKIYTCNGNNYKCLYSMIDYDDMHENLLHYSVWVRDSK